MARLLLDSIRTDCDVEREGGSFVMTMPMAALQGDRYMTLDCRLDPMPEHSDRTYEFSFGFTVADLLANEEAYFTQDRYEVRRYLRDLRTDFVMPTVAHSVGRLVERCDPEFVYRVTKARDLPDKALVKHQVVRDAFYGLGFSECETGTDPFKRTFWLLSR